METAIRQRAPKTGVKRRRLKGGAWSYGIDYVDASGQRVREWGLPTAELAKKARAQRVADAASGKHRIPTLTKQTFSSYVDQWLTSHKPRLKPSTLRLYEGQLKTYLRPHFGDASVQSVNTHDVRRFVAEVSGNGSSPKTVNNVLVLLKGIFRSALEEGVIPADPTAAVKRLKWHRPEMSFLTPAQVQTFLTACRRESYPLFLVGFTTGLRLGELMGLQWGDIDFASGFVHVRRSMYRGRAFDPKSDHSRRKVVLIPQTRHALHFLRTQVGEQRLAEGLPAVEATDHIFWNPRSPRAEMSVRREFQKNLRRAGLPTIRVHDMRHTFASLLIHQGESPKFIQAQLGHSSIETTFDLYGHLFPEAYEGAATRLQASLFGTDRQPIGPQVDAALSVVAEDRIQPAVINPAVP